MKRSVLVGLGLIPFFTGPIMAADLAVKAPAAKLSPVYNWTGCYAGAHFGSLFVQQDWAGVGANHDTGLMVGGQLGCNYQISTWVFGIQGDAAWSDATGTLTDQVSQWKTDSLASVTGRFGYAWDRLLSYGKAGGAWKHVKYDNGVATPSETRDGWTVGGGFEYAIINNVTMFFEYDFYDFGTRTVGFGRAAAVDIRDRDSLVKVGGNWKFSW
jgi:outer membrane immunogenic protein